MRPARRYIAGMLAMILLPPLCALALAWLQHAWYAWRVRRGAIAAADRPFFGILLFRGFLVTIGLAFVLALTAKAAVPNNEDDPWWSDEAREGIIEYKYGREPEPLPDDATNAPPEAP